VTIIVKRIEWDEEVRRTCSSIFENLPEASEELVRAEKDLDRECKRLNRAVKKWAQSDYAPEMDLHLRRLLENIAEHWSSLEALLEFVESMLSAEACLIEEMRKTRKEIRAKVG
jgi:hypothetical protein